MVDEIKYNYTNTSGSAETDSQLKGATIEKNSNDISIKNAQNGVTEIKDATAENSLQRNTETTKPSETQEKQGLQKTKQTDIQESEQILKQTVINKSLDETSLQLAVEQLKFLQSQGVKVHDDSVLANDIKNLASNAPEQAKKLGVEPENQLA